MVELPEAFTLADQLSKKVAGRKIIRVVAAFSPHKFAWYHDDPQNYQSLLKGKMINQITSAGGIVEIQADYVHIALSEGIGLRYHKNDQQLPDKHQLLIEFDDHSFLSVSVQMYGGILCFKEGTCETDYYLIAKEKPSPLSGEFNQVYFKKMIGNPELQKKSAKFFLATEQRIPGLGNGVLQDILLAAKLHPKTKLSALSDTEQLALYQAVKSVLKEMTDKGGRDTEKDLYGNNGGYITKLSKNTAGLPCSECGSLIKKENYMGGSIYFCPRCQELK
jgi:formamidopyrimidine-DNA glycosylase